MTSASQQHRGGRPCAPRSDYDRVVHDSVAAKCRPEFVPIQRCRRWYIASNRVEPATTALGAVKRSVLQWRFIDGVAAKIDEAALRKAQQAKDAVRAYEIVYAALGA